jgi:hypothetical protein
MWSFPGFDTGSSSHIYSAFVAEIFFKAVIVAQLLETTHTVVCLL